MDLIVSAQPINLADATAQFEQRAKGAGGIVTFAGQVREHNKSGDVQTLYLQSYSPMTETGIASAMQLANEHWPLIAICVRHRVGSMAPGDTIVFVGAASAHRRAAFEATDFLMDYLKTEAIFWKKETTTHGSQWIEPRDDDYADQARWSAIGKHNGRP